MINRPWTLKLEFSKGCNLSCKFCPIHALPEYNKNKQFLTTTTCERVVSQYAKINPEGRVELTMRGEPTINPYFLKNISLIRKHLPKSQISLFSNGVTALKDPTIIAKSFVAGVNIYNIDCYNNTYERFKKLAEEITTKYNAVELKKFEEFSAYTKYSKGHLLKVINLVPDIASPDNPVAARSLHTNAGNADIESLYKLGMPKLKKLPLVRQCGRPFREMVVCYNGDVVICCHDWKAEKVLGNVYSKHLYNIWYGEEHSEILKKLYVKDRALISPCNKCDYIGEHRLSLLKDPR
jgi:radical SAM protein with 4Fe4S-binding SPASM domain